MKPLSEEDLQINQQAAAVAASVLSEPVEAATRCQQVTEAMQAEAAGIRAPTRLGMRMSRAMKRAMPTVTPSAGAFKYMELGGLPDSFILAITTGHVYALEDRRDGTQLLPGKVLKTWDRGLRASVNPPQVQRMVQRAEGVPDDRQLLTLYLPIEGGGNRYLEAAARNVEGIPGAGFPRRFMVARDAPSQRVIDALCPTRSIVINRGSITPGGVAGRAPVAPPQPSATQRLQELENLRATGAISDAEYTAKRQKIIDEI